MENTAQEDGTNYIINIGSEASGIPVPVIYLSIYLYIILYVIIILTGLSLWISKCYNRSILISIIGSLVLGFWMVLYVRYVQSSISDSNEIDLEDLKQKFAIFLWLIVILAAVLSYGFYNQVTGKCGLLG